MQPFKALRLVLGLAVIAFTLSFTSPAAGQGKGVPSKDIKIPTFDGVTLSGKIYPNPGGKRDAIAVLLHHFDTSKGGNAQSEGWSDLVAALHEDGYGVLTFDFRGHGDSKTVNAEKFWSWSHNKNLLKGKKGDKVETISYSNFTPSYYPYLVNDVAAVKAYLDRRNDAKEVNSGNIVLVGAGDGAVVGSMWLAHEARRRRDKSGGMGLVPALGEAEVKDVAAAVWLSMTSSIGSKPVGTQTMSKWVTDVGKTNKVPMAFVYAKTDTKSDTLATALFRTLKPMGAKGKDLPHTIIERVPDTKLKGAALLDKDLKVVKGVVGDYLSKVMEDRGAREWNERTPDKSPYYYTASATSSKAIKVSKKAGDDVGQVDISTFLPTAVGP